MSSHSLISKEQVLQIRALMHHLIRIKSKPCRTVGTNGRRPSAVVQSGVEVGTGHHRSRGDQEHLWQMTPIAAFVQHCAFSKSSESLSDAAIGCIDIG